MTAKVVSLNAYRVMKEERNLFERIEREIEAEHPGLIAHMKRVIEAARERGYSGEEMADHLEELLNETQEKAPETDPPLNRTARGQRRITDECCDIQMEA